MRPLLYLTAVFLVLACLAGDSQAQCVGPNYPALRARLDAPRLDAPLPVLRALTSPVRAVVAVRPVRRMVAWRPLQRVADRVAARRAVRRSQ